MESLESVVYSHGLAFILDAMESSHPIEVPVSHPDEINEIFDGISYAKGAMSYECFTTLLGKGISWRA